MKGRVEGAAHPDLRLLARAGKLEFRLQCGATVDLATQRIRVEAGAIPLHLAIPFHKRRSVLAGSIGPFRLTIRPMEGAVRVADAHVAGTLGGQEGAVVELHVKGDCKADIDFAGQAPGKVLKAAFEGVFEE